MAYTATKPTGWKDGPPGAMRMALRDIALTGNYSTSGTGNTLSPSDFGLNRFFMLIPQQGVAAASDLATANEFSITINAAGTSGEISMYENAAAGSPSAEKTNAEAYITGQSLRVLAIGY